MKKNFVIAALTVLVMIIALVTPQMLKKDAPVEPENSTETITPPKEDKSFQGFTICIDPGHGKTTRKEKEPIYPGAAEKKATNVSGASGKLITEEELNLEVGLKLKSSLEAKGATVHITRVTHESDMSNVERAEFANNLKCDMVVRIHADGSESASVSGVSVLVPSKKRIIDGYLSEDIVTKSKICGEYILTKVCEKTGAKNRGISERADMTGFNWSAVPVVLLEMGFMSNPEEESKMVTSEYQEKIISGIIEGLDIYFNSNA